VAARWQQGAPGLPNIREHMWQRTHTFSTGPAVGSAASAPRGRCFSGGASPKPSRPLAGWPPPTKTSRRACRTGRCDRLPTSVSAAISSPWATRSYPGRGQRPWYSAKLSRSYHVLYRNCFYGTIRQPAVPRLWRVSTDEGQSLQTRPRATHRGLRSAIGIPGTQPWGRRRCLKRARTAARRCRASATWRTARSVGAARARSRTRAR
jgi:hypothetical protein